MSITSKSGAALTEERIFRHKAMNKLWLVQNGTLYFESYGMWKKARIMSLEEVTRNPSTYLQLSSLETKLLLGEVENE